MIRVAEEHVAPTGNTDTTPGTDVKNEEDIAHGVNDLAAQPTTHSMVEIVGRTNFNLGEDVFGLPFTASQYCFGKVFPV